MANACPRCSAAVPAEARFCMNCGHALQAVTDDAPDRQQLVAAQAPAPLVARMRAARVSGERKPVTAVFADIVGSTALAERMDPEEWTALINTAFELMSQAVYRYEGTVAQLQGDAMVCLFGAPIAHEDDPLRAVRAALDMVAVIDEFGAQLRQSRDIEFRIRAGINSGPVVVGNIGSNLSLEYTAVGDTMNVAARMQAAAEPGTVLLTQATYRLVTNAVEARDLGQLSVRGKEARVHAYRLLGLRQSPGPARGIAGLHSPMVGRDAELGQLAELVPRLKEARGQVALVVGEPGIGKSRLLDEFRARHLDSTGGRWVEGRCLSYGAGLPYHLVRDALRSLAGIGTPATDAEARAALAGWLAEVSEGSADGAAADYLGHLLALPMTAGRQQQLERMHPEALQARYAEAIASAARSAAMREPLVLVCEDAHWADPSSVELLIQVLPRIDDVPILLLVALRPDRQSEGWRLAEALRGRHPDRLVEIELQPLSETYSQALVGFLLEIESLPVALRQRILERAEGNPFFVEELVRMLIERGVLVRRGDRWTATPGVELVDIPETIHGLLLARIDRLDEASRWVLRVASVIGRQFAVDVLEAVLAADRRATDGPITSSVASTGQHLEALVEAGLLWPERTGAGSSYAFRHALIQEAAYGSLLHRHRAGLHRAVAQAIEMLHADLEDLAPELARHYREAGDLAVAAEWAFRGARHFERRSALREARALYDRAAEWLPAGQATVRRQVEIALGQGRTGVYLHSPEDESARLQAIVDDAEELGDTRLLVEIYASLAFALQLRGDQYGSSPPLQRAIDRAIDLGEALGDDPIRGQPMMVKGLARLLGGDLDEAVALLGPAVDMLEASGNLLYAFEAAASLNIALVRLGRFAESGQAIARMTDLAQRSGYPSTLLDLQSGIAMLRAEQGDLAAALAAAETAARGGEEHGILACAGFGYMVAGDISLRQGDAKGATRALRRSRELARRSGADFISLMGGPAAAAAQWSAGARKGALKSWAAALEAARQAGDRHTEADVLARRGAALAEEAEAGEEQLGAAIIDLEAAVAMFEQIGARPALGRTRLDLARAYRRVGRGAEADQVDSAARELLAELGLPPRGAEGEERRASAPAPA